jgi:hypothetical protein
MSKLSIVGKDYHTAQRVTGYHAGARRVWDQLGDFWGGLSGLLLGSAFYFIPGIGPVSIGIPKYRIMEYEKALVSDKFIVIAHGKPNDITQSQEYSRNARRGANHPHY